jgi:hypothetical protein
MNARPDDMTDAALAKWQYAHRDELDADEGDEVEVEISPQVSVTISFRLPGAEADAIRGAARDAGVSLSAWIRHACADAFAADETPSSRRAIEAELRDCARELEVLARRLDAAAHRGAAAVEEHRKEAKTPT